ncbi:MAG: hypothetical protein IKR74_03220 [Bacilli bacterium]|nr:hypothetical protein [Bacilli bacterium]
MKKFLKANYKRLILLMGVLAILVFFVHFNKKTFSEKTSSSIWDGTVAKSFSSGTGTSLDPYIISNGSELAYFFELINGDESPDYFNKNYEINNNINLNGKEFFFVSPNKQFSGTINGGGYTISNFTISNYYTDVNEATASFSLMSSLYNAEIKNINFKDITIAVNDKMVSEIIEEETKEEPIKENEKEISKDIEEITDGEPSKENNEEIIEDKNEEIKEEPSNEKTDGIDENIEEKTDEVSEVDSKQDINEDKKDEEEIEAAIRRVDASLFRNVEESTITNININNINIEYAGDKDLLNSSLFILNDNGLNNISNINISGSSEVKSTNILIDKFNGSTNLNNIMFESSNLVLIDEFDYTEKHDIYEYSIEKDEITFNSVRDLEYVVKSLNENSDLVWKYENGEFRIVNNGVEPKDIVNAPKSGMKRSTISAHDSGITNNTVYVNDLTSDLNYLTGLNYTEVRNTSLPSGNSTHYYDAENLVKVELIYDGSDLNNSNLVGSVSPINNETSNKYVYFKYIPLERSSNGTLATDAGGNNYIKIELIDNPFSKRPYANSTEYGFNGWVCNQDVDTTSGVCASSTFSINTDDYTRYMQVPIDGGSEVVIHLNANWYEADVVTSYNNITNLSSMTMVSTGYTVPEVIVHRASYFWRQNYTQMEFDRQYARGDDQDGYMPAGSFYRTNRNSGTYYYNSYRTRCSRNQTCYVFYPNTSAIVGGSKYNGGSVTFITNFRPTNSNTETTINSYNTTYMELLDDPDGQYSYSETVQRQKSYIPTGNDTQGFYYKVSNPTAAMLQTGMYYTSSGSLCTNTSSCSTAYKLIHYDDATIKSNGNSISIIEEDSNNEVIDGDKYYYLVTRDMNIVRITGTVSYSNLTTNRPYTLTGTAVNGTTASGTITMGTGRWTVPGDIVIENIRMDGPNYNTNTNNNKNRALGYDATNYQTYGAIFANSKNFKIGRNVTPSDGASYLSTGGIYGGAYGSSPSGLCRVIVESGNYFAYHSGRMSSSTTSYTFNETTIFGSDYDRVNNSHKKLFFEIGLDGYAGGNNTAGSESLFMSFNIIKSGTFGYNYDDTPNTDDTAGLYIGARASTYANSITGAKIEGGNINTIVGGYGYNGSETTNSTFIGMSGGTVRSIYGGAGHSTTKGNRIICVTGGTVSYSVLGGSNSFESGYTDDGVLEGSTLVYVGGNVTIGGQNDKLYGVESGTVFGAGGGDTSSTEKGTVYNSHVIINGGTINSAVYGGGNYGSTGTVYNNTSTAKIEVLSGTIGSVYGGSRSADFGKSNYQTSSLIDIDITGGTIGNVYGGSNRHGTIYGNIDVAVTGGTITSNVYGGGKGGAAPADPPDPATDGTFTTNGVNVTIGDSNGGPTINGSVYGGSAFGSVNDINRGNVNVTVNKGTITNSVFGGGQGDNTHTPVVNGNINVTVNGGTIGKVFGGHDQAGSHTKQNEVHLNGGTITDAFGGGNKSSVTNTHVYLSGATTTTIYGGSNTSGSVTTANVNISSGSATTVYGGNNEGGTCGTTNIEVTGGSIGTIYGGGNLVSTTTTNIDVYNHAGTITAIYGGGNNAGATTTNIDLHTRSGSNNIVVTNVYGGSNQSGNVNESNVTIDHGTVTNLYGGNNAGGKTVETNIIVNGGTVTTTYGGGNEAVSDDTNITINGGTFTTIYGGGNQAAITNDTNVTINSGTISGSIFGGGNAGNVGGDTNVIINGATNTIPAVYGGGNQAGATTTNITIPSTSTASITNIYGGSNQSGNITTTNTTISGGTVTNVYGGNNAGGVSSTTNVTINGGTLTNIYGGGNLATVGATNVTVNGSTNTISAIYGGGNQAGATTTSISIPSASTASVTNIYGGSNQSGNVTTTTISSLGGTIGDIYGGNNQGGISSTTNVTVGGSTVTNVYGGGNLAAVGATNVTINSGTITGSVYGGGNQAAVNNNTSLKIFGGTISGNVFGGGNDGATSGNTNVIINNGTINGSAYGGGNGSNATVLGNTNITVGGTTTIGTANCVIKSQCSLFGGGNAAFTGDSTLNTSQSNVKILGATIYGNIYGGANTSVVYGGTSVNIGADVATTSESTRGNVLIHGTVFGGGEANASGSENYDWHFVGVTEAIYVNINALNYNNFIIEGSIFGSGNASTTTGTSTINIKNYGTFANPKHNISIQRTNLLVIDNSAFTLSGATDRTNEYSDVLFTLSIIDEMDLKNNSTLFLETGANELRSYKSLQANGDPVTITINDELGTFTRDADNRIYMYGANNKVLNIANETLTTYGDVEGMTFFGLFKYGANNSIVVGIYDDYAYGAHVDLNSGLFTTGSYVLGAHKNDHDITADGFYSNFVDEEGINTIKIIEPTPADSPMYMWIIGQYVQTYEVNLVASKYSTMGAVELPLIDYTVPNTTFEITRVDFTGLESGVQIVNKNSIPKISSNLSTVDTTMGLSMETSNTGWLTAGQTSFYNTTTPQIQGLRYYIGENSTNVPSLLFYLYHSKNLQTTGSLGTIQIEVSVTSRIDDLTSDPETLIINVNISRILIATNDYEAALTAGRKYDLFTPTTTKITSKSSISAYFSLFSQGQSIYGNGYHRALVSNIALPENTKITMIDLSLNEAKYYYHVITAADVAAAESQISFHNEANYDLSMFEVMGAFNSGVHYNDSQMNSLYYSQTGGYCQEEFIFIIDFEDTEFADDSLDNYILFELQNGNDQTMVSVLGIQEGGMHYDIYDGLDAVIDISGTISSDTIYSGETVTMDLQTNYTQSQVAGIVINDTHMFDQKVGLKLTLFKNNQVVSGVALLGLTYEIDGVDYSPNIDGTTRIKISERVGNIETWVKVKTGTSNLATGNYVLRVESFGSPDGIYYGLNTSDYVDFNISIINEIYGLDVDVANEDMIVYKETGYTLNNSNNVTYTIGYNSGLTNPSIRLKMYRRSSYSVVGSTNYSVVDLADYVSNTLQITANANEYLIVSSPAETTTLVLSMNDDLTPGTYMMQFMLYDNNSLIGTVEKYIIIK